MRPSAAGAPERLQALSIRLHARLWKETGHGFNRLRDLLIPDKTGLRISNIATLTKAATMKDICLHDVDRGLQLIEGIQVFLLLLSEESPEKLALLAITAVQALGLEEVVVVSQQLTTDHITTHCAWDRLPQPACILTQHSLSAAEPFNRRYSREQCPGSGSAVRAVREGRHQFPGHLEAAPGRWSQGARTGALPCCMDHPAGACACHSREAT